MDSEKSKYLIKVAIKNVNKKVYMCVLYTCCFFLFSYRKQKINKHQNFIRGIK